MRLFSDPGLQFQRPDHCFDIGEIVEDEVGSGGFQRGAGISAGSHSNGAGVDGLGACNVVRRVADDVDIGALEIDAVFIAGALPGKGAEEVALMGIIREGAKGEVLHDPVMAELELGAAAEVAGEQAHGDVRHFCKSVEDFREAGEEASVIVQELRLEVAEIALKKRIHIFASGFDGVDLENAPGDPNIGFSGNLDIAKVLLPAKAVAEREGQGLLPRAAGMEDGLIDIEEDKLRFQNEKRSGGQ